MGYWFEIGYKGHRKLTFAGTYEDAVKVAHETFGGCDWLRIKGE